MFITVCILCFKLRTMRLVKHRVVRDNYAGFECQIWRVWWPFWTQMGYCNTFNSLEKAKNYIKNNGAVVWSQPIKPNLDTSIND